MSKLKIVVIGAGLSGLCVAKYAQSYGHEVTIYEQTAQLGGTWFYTDEVGCDDYGLDIHTSMYHNLRTNLPKELMGFDGFPMPQSPTSFVTSDKVLPYLNSYAEQFDVIKFIKYRLQVIRVHPLNSPSGTKWEVKVYDLPNAKLETHLYDAIFVCNGRNFCSYTPHFEGIDQFEGNKIHSRYYRRASSFKDKIVLIIGGGYSGIDLSYAISKTARKVFFSHHTHCDTHIFQSNVVKKGKIKKFTKTGVIFTDDTEEAITDVIFCTGFRVSMPFLSIDCGIVVDDSYVSPLYKHCINIKYPTMAIIGLTNTAAITQMIDIQVRFCMHYLNGKGVLPSVKEMLADTEQDIGKRFSLGWSKNKAHSIMGPFQREYYEDLAVTANIARVRDVYIKMYYDCFERRLRNPEKYRDDVYKIIEDEKFERISLYSGEVYKSN